jgi:hypothetical protein
MRLVVIWAVVTLIMIYAPVIWSRRMIEGVHLPLCLLAASGLISLLARVPSTIARRALAGGFLAVMCISTVQFVQQSLLLAQKNDFAEHNRALWASETYRRNVLAVLDPQRRGSIGAKAQPTVLDIWEGFREPYYLTDGDAAALRFLDQQTKTTPQAVLCLSILGNYVPRETGLYVYAGHGNHTLRFPLKVRQTMRFYSGEMPADEALSWLRENRIGYVIEGYYERAFPPQMMPSRRLHLPKLFEQSGTAVYAVPPG